jgi:hypothetical protein
MTIRSWLLLLPAVALPAQGPRIAAGEGPPAPAAGSRGAEARAGAILLDRDRVDRAVNALADAWFLVEREGDPLGYHRIRVRRAPDGGFQVIDDLVMASPAGKIAIRSEVTTGPDILGPVRASCQTFQGPEEAPALRGGMEFGREKIDLTVELFADSQGARLPEPRRKSGAEKRPPGPILIQSLVPLLLSTLPAAEDGTGLGKLVLIEMPADLDHLVAWKRDRRIAIETTQGRGRRVVVESAKERAEAATLRFGEEGEITRIEMPDMAERRTGEEEVRRAVPQAFKGG